MEKPSDKVRVKRIPKRGIYDRSEIYEILDKDCVCHVAFVYDGYPVIIPTIYGRSGDELYLHGASTSRMMMALAEGIPVSIAVTKVNGIVLARSLFNSSMNYESVVLFGHAKEVTSQEEKNQGLAVISDQILKGRWEEARQPSAKELKATKLLKVYIQEASAKRREGDPGDEKADYALDIWAGVIPIHRSYGEPIDDSLLKEGISRPHSVKAIVK
ncbi:pyridoxamine 5'-phosphate oxidase family protein [Portibacter marinus]|uniref:pyridoxamine 5'-phosphate oxidase family protein n=1 Tax=Portibacter marinus TaxID=2898660 RepID=UPI001F278891|nr:pyridoxamine 5'-phosphate oxidase family protein [Portibacter marinus]